MKVSIIGAGNVGAHAALRIYSDEIASELVLLDVVDGLAAGKALDMMQSAPLVDSDCRLRGSTEMDDTANSDVVVVSAGMPRRPGMSYDDLLVRNAETVRRVTRELVARSPHAILIIVSNPLDEMTYVAVEASGLPRHRVMGMSGILDSSRLRAFIAEELDVAIEDVSALVVGTRTEMVPLVRFATVAGIPLSQWLPAARIDAIVERTRRASDEILDKLKTVSAFFAPSAAIAAMVEAVARDKRRIVPCAVRLEGEYGLDDVVIGTPAKVGRRGVEQIVEVDLLEKEYDVFRRAATRVRENLNKIS